MYILGADVFDYGLHESEEGQDISVILNQIRCDVFVETDQINGEVGVVIDQCYYLEYVFLD